jgi:hypothetical protein
MQTVDRSTLRSWLDERRNFALVGAPGADAFQQFHLPRAINVPVYDYEVDKMDWELAALPIGPR